MLPLRLQLLDKNSRGGHVGIIFADANQAVEVFGVKLIGVNAENGLKLLLTLAFVAVLVALGWLIPALANRLLRANVTCKYHSGRTRVSG